jgi:hypothetical protein
MSAEFYSLHCIIILCCEEIPVFPFWTDRRVLLDALANEENQ